MIGLDLSFCFENMISADVEKAVTDNKEQIIEGIKFRGAVSAYWYLLINLCYKMLHILLLDGVKGNSWSSHNSCRM